MNIAKSLKKLASNQTFVVLAAVVAVAAVYYYTQSFNTPVGAMTGQNEAAEAAEAAAASGLERQLPRAWRSSCGFFVRFSSKSGARILGRGRRLFFVEQMVPPPL